MLAVIVAWVPFRAESMDSALQILAAMSGQHGFVLPEHYFGYLNKLAGLGDHLVTLGWAAGDPKLFTGVQQVGSLILLTLVAVIFPNTQQVMRRYRPAFETYQGEIPRLHLRWLEWRPQLLWSLLIALLAVVATLYLNKISEFLYFQF